MDRFLQIKFIKRRNGYICEYCNKLETHKNYANMFGENNIFIRGMSNYLDNHSRVLLAYSGGLDSTAILSILKEECDARNIDMRLFTVITGYKGKRTLQNIENVLRHFKLRDKHRYYDIRKRLYRGLIKETFGREMKVSEVYGMCFKKNILPCGPLCNSIIDSAYRRIMSNYGVKELITGGDTPIIDKDNNFTIFWHKEKENIVTVRAGVGFGLNKKKNTALIKRKGIPWRDPMCGGYDTDCLVPGAILTSLTGGVSQTSLQEVLDKFPIVLHYLADRVRFGVIEREHGFHLLNNIDLASSSAYMEMKKLAEHYTSKKV